MKSMNEAQFNIVKFYLDNLKVPPKKLFKKWNFLWLKQGSAMRIELADIYRVYLCRNYQVYENDSFPDEDVLLAMEGAK